MNKSKWMGVAAAALVAGLVLGNLASATAATGSSTNTSATSTIASCALGIGRTVRDAGGRLLDVVASLTGKSTDDVAAERAAGKTFGQIAAESNVTTEAVVAKALDVRKTALDDAVKSGQITQSQADAAVERMTARISARVDSTGGACGAGGNGGGCGMGGGRGAGRGAGNGGGCGMGGGACATTSAQ